MIDGAESGTAFLYVQWPQHGCLMVRTAIVITFSMVLMAIGFGYLLAPRAAQAIAVRAFSLNQPKAGTFGRWMDMNAKFITSQRYRLCLRFLGLAMILLASVFIWATVITISNR